MLDEFFNRTYGIIYFIIILIPRCIDDQIKNPITHLEINKIGSKIDLCRILLNVSCLDVTFKYISFTNFPYIL